VIAVRGAYDDRALESRFLTEVMGNAPLRGDIPINLPVTIKDEALALRNKLLLYRFKHRNELRLTSDAPIALVTPRINQILTPLLSIIDDPVARDGLIRFAKAAHDGMVAERSLTTEAHLLEIVRELSDQGTVTIAVGDIATRFADRFGDEYARPITPRWIGTILRRRLHFLPHKSHGRYVLPVIDKARLSALYDRYGISETSAQKAGVDGSGAIVGGHGDLGTTK
jgi:hypothetical protein